MLKMDSAEHPVPEPLRLTFRQIAEAFVARDYRLLRHDIAGVKPIDPETAEWISGNVAAYGETLAPLDDETWNRSIYRWMEGYWQFIVDLTTTSEPVSDRALHAKLFEEGDAFVLTVEAVYVP